MNEETVIGRVIATEKKPTTMESFCFWTDKNLILNPFDVVIVDNESNGSKTYAIIESISHITDSASFLSDFISNDFGDVKVNVPTYRIGMNYVEANVVGNDKNIFIPVQSNAQVRLASKDEISYALGLNQIESKLVCGYLQMYQNVTGSEKITLPVPIDSRYLIGPEGAHLNISGISGLAAKTSYSMFLMKSIQDKQIKGELDDDVAFVIFNVKGNDLLAIDEPNDFGGNRDEYEETSKIYEMLGLSCTPFENVKYLYPYKDTKSAFTYLDSERFEDQIRAKKAYKYKFIYENDRENLDLLFANIDDPTHTMDSILNLITSGSDGFDELDSWKALLDTVEIRQQAGSSSTKKDIPVQSWRKFYRLIRNSIENNNLFGTKITNNSSEIRLETAISKIEKNSVYVIDIAKLSSDMQGFVFGNVIRSIYDLQLGVINSEAQNRPAKIVIFMDELNKFASTDTPKDSPILRQILDIAERGRSLGVILFGAEQFKSALHSRVSGNCSTFAYGRTNAIELSKGDYKYIPNVYKAMMTRLNQGEYIVQNPVFKALLNVKFPKPIYKQFK